MLKTFLDHLGVLWGSLAALAVALVLTPAAGRVAEAVGAVDDPVEARKVHTLPVPRLGGVALLLAVLASALAFVRLDDAYRGILLGALVATIVGVIDDLRGLPWWLKLAGQFGAAGVAVAHGVTIGRFTFPFLGIVHGLPGWVAVPATLGWIVALMNMVNFLDGMDGLAAGVCGIAGGTFSVIALSLGKPQAAVLAAIVAGACLGFMRHNFYPARIFMGDSGALLLGFVLATVTIEGLLKTAATVALFFPLFTLALPIFDTSFVIARRLKYRRPLYEADAGHLHHRFVKIGFSQRRAVFYLWSWCGILAADALATRFVPFRAHGRWNLEPSLAVGALALLTIASSLYIVYLLEILKLLRLRTWRERQRLDRAGRARRSA